MANDKCGDGLKESQCEPCSTDTAPLTPNEYTPLLDDLGGNWEIEDKKRLAKTYKFPDFMTAVDFVNKIAAEAEAQGHHPDIELGYGKVLVRVWTHKIGGLSRNDFILAARIDALPQP